MEIIGGFFYSSNNYGGYYEEETNRSRTTSPDMEVEQILEKLEQQLLKKGWTIIEDEALEEKDNG
jgi:hypothetical protein